MLRGEESDAFSLVEMPWVCVQEWEAGMLRTAVSPLRLLLRRVPPWGNLPFPNQIIQTLLFTSAEGSRLHL